MSYKKIKIKRSAKLNLNLTSIDDVVGPHTCGTFI